MYVWWRRWFYLLKMQEIRFQQWKQKNMNTTSNWELSTRKHTLKFSSGLWNCVPALFSLCVMLYHQNEICMLFDWWSHILVIFSKRRLTIRCQIEFSAQSANTNQSKVLKLLATCYVAINVGQMIFVSFSEKLFAIVNLWNISFLFLGYSPLISISISIDKCA